MSSSEESKPAAAAAGGGPSGGESGPSHASAPGQDAYKKHVTVEGGLQKKTRRSAKQHKGRHHIEVPEHAERELGVVISHQEKFGFIKSVSRDARYFFHVSDTDGSTAPFLRVSFVIAKDLTTGKDVAYDVRALPGAQPPAATAKGGRHDGAGGGRRGVGGRAGPHVGRGGQRGEGELTWGQEKERALAAAAAEAAGGAGRVLHPDSSPPEGGPLGEQPPLGGSGGQVGAGVGAAGPAAGDGEKSTGTAAAEGGRLGGEPSPQALQRHQVAGLERYSGLEGRGGVKEGPPQHAQHGKGRKGPKEEHLPGTFRGVVAQPSCGSRKVQLDDGLILYRDEAGSGLQYEAKYGNCRLLDPTPRRLEVGDLVEFEVVKNLSTGVLRAVSIKFLAKSVDPSPSLEAAIPVGRGADSKPHAAGVEVPAPEVLAAAAAHAAVVPPAGRQLGRVTLLKKEFGFIRQMERLGDMFFHFTQLQGIAPSEIQVGDDVEYTVRRDESDGKLSAVAVRLAPPGAVVFDHISEEPFWGELVEKPVPTKQYVQSSGVLKYVPPEGGPRVKLAFGVGDATQPQAMRVGDHVTFRLATNLQVAKAAAARGDTSAAAKHAGRRAVEVAVARVEGRVVAMKTNVQEGGRGFGFISCKDLGGEDRKVFFHTNEVLGDKGTPITLKPGDEVSFVLHTQPKTGELNAQRVRRVREAPEGWQPPKPEDAPQRNPNQMKFVGNLTSGEHRSIVQPKGPDGTRGFSMGRGKGLPPPPGKAHQPAATPGAVGDSPFSSLTGAASGVAATADSATGGAGGAGARLEPHRSLSSGSMRSLSGLLNPSAASFVPRTASLDRLVSVGGEPRE